MSNALYNLAAMTVASSGTGTITLSSAATINGVTYLSFSSAGVPGGAQVYYSILDSSASEIGGPATYLSSNTTLARNPTNTTNGGAAIDMSRNAVVLVSPPASQFREVLTAARTYYVSSGGSDSNTGLSSAAPFATIQKAIDTVATLDMSTFQVTIQLSSGTYTGTNSVRSYVGLLPPIIVGNEVTPSSVLISVPSGCWNSDQVPPWHLRGMRLTSSGAGHGISVINNGTIYFQNIDFSTVTAGFAQIRASYGGAIQTTGPYTISAGAEFHALATNHGIYVTINSTQVTLSSTPAFATAFAYATQLGNLYCSGTTFSGTATGSRYQAILNGVIYTGTGSSTFFPGNVTGATATGGQYG